MAEAPPDAGEGVARGNDDGGGGRGPGGGNRLDFVGAIAAVARENRKSRTPPPSSDRGGSGELHGVGLEQSEGEALEEKKERIERARLGIHKMKEELTRTRERQRVTAVSAVEPAPAA